MSHWCPDAGEIPGLEAGAEQRLGERRRVGQGLKGVSTPVEGQRVTDAARQSVSFSPAAKAEEVRRRKRRAGNQAASAGASPETNRSRRQ